LRQCRLEAGLDVLGVNEANRQPVRQRIEKSLHRLGAAQRCRQQPDFRRRLARNRLGSQQRPWQLQAFRSFFICAQPFETRTNDPGRVTYETF